MKNTTSFASETYLPNPDLRKYIQAYVHTKVSTNEEFFYVDLCPVGYAVISFTFNEFSIIYIADKEVRSRLNITGQLMKKYQMKVKGINELLYVLFTPLGAYKLLSLPQDSLSGDFFDMLTLPIPSINDLLNDLTQNIPDITKCVEKLDNWFLEKLDENSDSFKIDLFDEILLFIKNSENVPTVKELYTKFNFSKITFERHFKQVIGLAPKEFLRITRFGRAYQIIQQHLHKSWTELALENGYFDQAHFIKEFKTIYGYTPSKMHESLVNISNHVRQLMEVK
jgi:AraC-like DNA-binding protein